MDSEGAGQASADRRRQRADLMTFLVLYAGVALYALGVLLAVSP